MPETMIVIWSMLEPGTLLLPWRVNVLVPAVSPVITNERPTVTKVDDWLKAPNASAAATVPVLTDRTIKLPLPATRPLYDTFAVVPVTSVALVSVAEVDRSA